MKEACSSGPGVLKPPLIEMCRDQSRHSLEYCKKDRKCYLLL